MGWLEILIVACLVLLPFVHVMAARENDRNIRNILEDLIGTHQKGNK